MEDLDQNWILLNNTNCQMENSSPSTLGLTNMAGVFILVGAGIILGIFVIFLEIEYKKRKEKKVRKHDISRNAFATWRKNIEVLQFHSFFFKFLVNKLVLKRNVNFEALAIHLI